MNDAIKKEMKFVYIVGELHEIECVLLSKMVAI